MTMAGLLLHIMLPNKHLKSSRQAFHSRVTIRVAITPATMPQAVIHQRTTCPSATLLPPTGSMRDGNAWCLKMTLDWGVRFR